VIIIGQKKLQDTELNLITNNYIFNKRVFYLSQEDGIDFTSFKKANIYCSRGVYLLGQLCVDKSSEIMT
jgi:hypothetical protein